MLPRIGFLIRNPLRLFDFRQPRIQELNCIHLVFKKKCLLLINWDASPATHICISPGGIRYYSSSGGGVCKLPSDANAINIVVCNVWRSNKQRFHLKQLTVDSLVFRYFEEYFITRVQVVANIHRAQPKAVPIQPVSFAVNMPLTIQPFSFHPSFNHHQLNDYAP